MDPNRTKRPPNAYMLYCVDYRVKFLNEDPSLDHRSVMAKLGEHWNQLSDEDKLPYRKIAFDLQNDFKKKNPNYKYTKRKLNKQAMVLDQDNIIDRLSDSNIQGQITPSYPPLDETHLLPPIINSTSPPTIPNNCLYVQPFPVKSPQGLIHIQLPPLQEITSLDSSGLPRMPPAPVLSWLTPRSQ